MSDDACSNSIDGRVLLLVICISDVGLIFSSSRGGDVRNEFLSSGRYRFRRAGWREAGRFLMM